MPESEASTALTTSTHVAMRLLVAANGKSFQRMENWSHGSGYVHTQAWAGGSQQQQSFTATNKSAEEVKANEDKETQSKRTRGSLRKVSL